jgi:DNA-binding XRE family transcriptional regulator
MGKGSGYDHVPTPETRVQVRTMSAFGIPQNDIAKYIGISKPTLHAHYRDELDRGMLEANMKIAQTLYSIATGTPGDPARGIPAKEPDKVSCMFWLKARAGWREKGYEDSDNQVVVNFTIARDNGDSND